jgi:hypothetical protein
VSGRRGTARKVTVRIAARSVLYVDGVAYVAGQEVELDAAEAEDAIASGIAVDPSAPPASEPEETAQSSDDDPRE